jgi:subtilisin family serine protease
MPEVIAVGGVDIDADDGLSVWPLSSSFTTGIFPTRWVPDVCSLAGEMMLPEAAAGPPFSWEPGPAGTSGAAPQVAGIAALLLQKDPTLTPAAVLAALTNTADDVENGTAASGQMATKGPDRATGAGLVNALRAWKSLP